MTKSGDSVCIAQRFYRIVPIMDAIVIRDLRVEALIGIHRRERHVLQTVSIDLEIGVPGSAVFTSDQVADTIDYEQVALRIRALASSGHFRLVETFADRIAALLLNDLGAPWVKVSAAKVGILANAKFVGVTIERRRPS
jgi:dihydroneopterin aldolase